MKTMGTAFRLFMIMTILLGVLYPLSVTKIGQVFFKNQAQGSLIHRGDQVIGSALIAQEFTQDSYFWPRPSACHYSAPSAASNYSLTADGLQAQLKEVKSGKPGDLVFASGSGFDPHLSQEAILYQVARVAAARHLDETSTTQLTALVTQLTKSRDLGIFGEPCVNVLQLNLQLDQQFPVTL